VTVSQPYGIGDHACSACIGSFLHDQMMRDREMIPDQPSMDDRNRPDIRISMVFSA
jgi:hypothetical protein